MQMSDDERMEVEEQVAGGEAGEEGGSKAKGNKSGSECFGSFNEMVKVVVA